MSDTVPQVALRGITKRFGPVVANDGVDFDLFPGEIHALLGENGAGKSTLMNILYGLYQPDAGAIRVEGRPARFTSSREAIAHGIGMVHQHFMLVPALTVVENVILGTPAPREPLLDRRGARRRVAETARRFGLDVELDAPVWQLPVGVQQRVEILKALFRGARTLILDEPTAVLTPQEVEEFFGVLRGLRDGGQSIIFITHKLHEVRALCDRVTVLRAGRVVDTLPAAAAPPAALARMMVGHDLGAALERPLRPLGEPVLEAEDLLCLNARGLPGLRGISFALRAGEVLGVAGVDGNGQSELAEVLAGLRPSTAGRVRVQGRDYTGASPARLIAAGLGHIPQDRQQRGLVLDLSLAENLILQRYADPPFARWATLNRAAIAENADRLMREFDIRAASRDAAVRTLSGGNQQKAILAREFARRPAVLLAVQPTRGLDIGATQFVHERLLEARAARAGVLLISTELDEVLALADRIAVMFEGRIVETVEAAAATREAVGLMMAGHAVRSGVGSPR